VGTGGGTINLKTGEMDLKPLDPKPKDSTIASLNSPLYVRGTFSDPKPSLDVGKLATKGAGAILLGIVNPLLAAPPLFKEGKVPAAHRPADFSREAYGLFFRRISCTRRDSEASSFATSSLKQAAFRT
jgi:hypothetical protein